MTTQRSCIIFLVLLFSFDASLGIPGVHYHRYMLSDYRPQHSNKTQMDYNPLPRPKYSDTDDDFMLQRSQSSEQMVKLDEADEEKPLGELLVRIYSGKEYKCMGTLITESIVMTTATCLFGVNEKLLKIKTSANLVLDNPKVVENDHVLTMIVLDKPMPRMNFSAQFCESPLTTKDTFKLSTYIRSSHVVHSHTSSVLPLSECRRLLPDPHGQVVRDTTICVKNEKKTSKCQRTNGTPLIHKGHICGVNILGHNCPEYTGVDLYESVINEAAYLENILKTIKKSQLEDIL